ncbi:MAG: YitT family protein [Clostridia bacterium]|nr:YitT family protein [Clostridia bacterium]
MENTIKKSTVNFKLINFLMLVVAGIVNSFGVVLFLFPVKLYDSGISGLSMLLDQVTSKAWSLSLFLILINAPIFAFVYSLFAISIYSLSSYLIMYVLPIDVSFVSPLAEQDLFLCAIFGGMISGIGSGLTIKYGGAMDGIDVLSVTFAKRIGLSIGTFVLIFNIILYIICGVVIDSWILPLYSIITYFVGSKTVDFIVDGFNRSKCAMIITNKPSEIVEELSKHFSNSGTVVNAYGGYSKDKKNIIFFVLNHFQVNKLKTIVKGIDPLAYISMQDVSDVVKTSNLAK